MPFSVQPITRENLPSLKALLDASAGYDVVLEEELVALMDDVPANWLTLIDDHKPVGFISSFSRGEWGNVEFYLDSALSPDLRKHAARQLIQAFTAKTQMPGGFRLRFEIPSSQTELIACVKEAGYVDRIETFLHFKFDLAKSPEACAAVELALLRDLKEIRATFENLHPVKDTEVANWIEARSVYVSRTDGHITSAAQVFEQGTDFELLRIATHPLHLRKGSAETLLYRLHANLGGQGHVHLKVDENKRPAQSLYEKIGYVRVPASDQIWLSKTF